MKRVQTRLFSVMLTGVALVAFAGCAQQKDDGAPALTESTSASMAESAEDARAHAQAVEAPVATGSAAAPAGFEVHEADGRLYVFMEGSDAAAEYAEKGPASVADGAIFIGAGPNGETLRSADRATLEAFVAAIRGE